VGNPHVGGSSDITINHWIKWVLINGGGSPISFVDRVNQEPLIWWSEINGGGLKQ